MRLSIALSLFAVAATLSVALPASAQPMCWARIYAPEHLSAHPDQQVAEMMLALQPPAPDGVALGLLWVSLRPAAADPSVRSHEAAVICGPPEGGQRDCSVACDGGLFSVTHRTSDRSVLLTNGSGGLSFLDCGAENFDDYYFLPEDAEHREFRLFECDK